MVGTSRPSRSSTLWRILALVLALGGAGAAYHFWPSEDPAPTRSGAGPAEPSKPNSVIARARIEPQGRVRVIHGQERAVLQAVLVREGDVVKKGDPLAELNTLPFFNAKLALEERKLDEMRALADQVKAPAKSASRTAQQAIIRQRQTELAKAEQELARAERLRANDTVSAQKYDERKSEVDAARHALSEAQATHVSMSETRDIDVVVANVRISTQRAAVDQARAERDRAVILAPIDGTILFVFARAGELLGDEGLLQMADMTALIAVAEVNEADMLRVAAGQPAILRGPLLAEPIEGVVARSSETIFKQKRPTSDVLVGRDARIAEVEILPKGRLPRLVGAELTVEIKAR